MTKSAQSAWTKDSQYLKQKLSKFRAEVQVSFECKIHIFVLFKEFLRSLIVFLFLFSKLFFSFLLQT